MTPTGNPSAAAQALMARLGYTFANPSLLTEALTHPSASQPGSAQHYQRLEFVGDRVLGLLVAEALWQRYPTAAEGELAVRHTAAVNTRTLAQVAARWQLAQALVMQGPEGPTPAVLADAVEALLGAIWLDGGAAPARTVVQRDWAEVLAAPMLADAKTRLQEHLQQARLPLPDYAVLDATGPDHAKHFTVQVSTALGQAQGQGASKALAGMAAAEALLAQLKPTPDPVA